MCVEEESNKLTGNYEGIFQRKSDAEVRHDSVLLARALREFDDVSADTDSNSTGASSNHINSPSSDDIISNSADDAKSKNIDQPCSSDVTSEGTCDPSEDEMERWIVLQVSKYSLLLFLNFFHIFIDFLTLILFEMLFYRFIFKNTFLLRSVLFFNFVLTRHVFFTIGSIVCFVKYFKFYERCRVRGVLERHRGAHFATYTQNKKGAYLRACDILSMTEPPV